MALDGGDCEKLVDVFNKVWTSYHEIDGSSEPSSSSSLQSSVDDTMKQILFLIQSVNELSMFSDNEDIEEVSTSDLRYFLLHALAAILNSKKQCDIKSRPSLIEHSLEHLQSFLKLCLVYDFGRALEIQNVLKNVGAKDNSFAPKKDLSSLNAAREAKIARYRKSKLQAQQIQEMEKKLHDEEISRKYWMLQIDKWIDCAIEEIGSIKMELDMLNRFKDVSKDELQAAQKPSKPPMKPFILTKDKLQATVFGAGYPSLPTMTLDEYFEKEAAAGRMPDQPLTSQNGKKDQTENNDDSSDDESIKKKREFDDWKDTHRRGTGNRKNMG